MNLIFKAAVGIYIISVLVFSSFSKADADFVLSTDLYDLAKPPVSISDMIDTEQSLSDSAIIISNLEGELNLSQEGDVFFISYEDDSTFFKIPHSTINHFGIDKLPLSVRVSGFYQPKTQVSAYERLNTLNVRDIQIN